MQATSKVVAWIIVAILVIGGIYYWVENRAPVTPAPSDQSSQAAASQDANASAAPTLPSGSDTSDAGLNSDSAAISGKMSAMDSDTASIDSGMNDQPVSQ